MMEQLFLTVLNMSLKASLVILAVLLIRLLLKKLPKAFASLLWLVVLFRLLCPFSFESALSLVPLPKEVVPTTIATAEQPQIETGIAPLDEAVNDLLPAPAAGDSANPMQIWLFAASGLWSAGVAVLLANSLLATLRLKRRVAAARATEAGYWELPGATTPFVFGLLRPKIYLPPNLPESERSYLLHHERTHLRRKDHWIKPLGFFAVCLHWFNPLVWLAFWLLCEDMELSCDERVIRELGSGIKRDYSASLLAMSTGRRICGSSPLAFGENNTKERIKNVLRYKKRSRWGMAAMLALVLLLGVGLLANPRSPVYAITAIDYERESGQLTFTVSDEISSAWEPVIEVRGRSNAGGGMSLHLFEMESLTGSWQTGRTYQEVCDAEHLDFLEITTYLRKKDQPETIKNEMTVTIDAAGNLTGFLPAAARPAQEQRPTREELTRARQLFADKTPYVGNNSKVGALIYQLVFPETMSYDHFELKTDAAPYRVTIVLNAESEVLAAYSEEDSQWVFRKNAYLLFALIDNLDEVKYLLNDGTHKQTIYLERDAAETAFGCELGVYAESEVKLAELLSLLDAGEQTELLPGEEPTVQEVQEQLLKRGLTEAQIKSLFHLSLSPEELLLLKREEAEELLARAKKPNFIT